MKGVIFLAALLLSSLSFAGEAAPVKLKHFRAGDYRLSAGKENECAFGDFEVSSKNDAVNLGPLHAFLLKPEAGELKGDAPGDETCTYKYSYSVESTSSADHLKFSETRRCGKEVKHTLVKSASIQSETIILEAEQKGSPGFKYSCVWERDTGLADAGF